MLRRLQRDMGTRLINGKESEKWSFSISLLVSKSGHIKKHTNIEQYPQVENHFEEGASLNCLHKCSLACSGL